MVPKEEEPQARSCPHPPPSCFFCQNRPLLHRNRPNTHPEFTVLMLTSWFQRIVIMACARRLHAYRRLRLRLCTRHQCLILASEWCHCQLRLSGFFLAIPSMVQCGLTPHNTIPRTAHQTGLLEFPGNNLKPWKPLWAFLGQGRHHPHPACFHLKDTLKCVHRFPQACDMGIMHSVRV